LRVFIVFIFIIAFDLDFFIFSLSFFIILLNRQLIIAEFIVKLEKLSEIYAW
jgi:hypothetical protein